MVSIAITYLIVENFIPGMALDKVIRDPLYIAQCIFHLSALLISFLIFVNGPAEHGCRISHREIEFDVVAGIVPAASKINVIVRSVCKA